MLSLFKIVDGMVEGEVGDGGGGGGGGREGGPRDGGEERRKGEVVMAEEGEDRWKRRWKRRREEEREGGRREVDSLSGDFTALLVFSFPFLFLSLFFLDCIFSSPSLQFGAVQLIGP